MITCQVCLAQVSHVQPTHGYVGCDDCFTLFTRMEHSSPDERRPLVVAMILTSERLKREGQSGSW